MKPTDPLGLEVLLVDIQAHTLYNHNNMDLIDHTDEMFRKTILNVIYGKLMDKKVITIQIEGVDKDKGSTPT